MRNSAAVAVTSRSFSRHPILRNELLRRYETATFNDIGQVLAKDELVKFLRGHVKAILALDVVDEHILAQLPELRVVSKFGVGLDTFDLHAFDRHGVLLGWTPGVNTRSVSELVVALAITLLRHVVPANLEVRSGIWGQRTGQYLSGRAVGVIGCGHIGKDVICLLKPFECEVLCYDIVDFSEFFNQDNVKRVPLDDLLRRSDVVTLHVPLTPETQYLLSAERLALMKPTAILINLARGKLVDESALKVMLMNGKLAGAAFDVFANEPPDDMELLNLPNFLATPHLGGSTEEAILAMGRAAIAGLDTARPVRELGLV